MELSPKSKAIIERFKVHRFRCLDLAFFLGEDAADSFHARFKSDPGGDRAREEYERLVFARSN